MSNTEHLHFEVKVDKVKAEFNVPQTTGSVLKQKGNVPPDYELWEVNNNGPDTRINDTDVVMLHSGQKFFSVKPTIDPGAKQCY